MRAETAREWVVMKFGGTSVSSAQCWETICEQSRKHLDAGKHVLLVVSALSGMTNLLTRLAEGAGAEERATIRADIVDRHECLCRETETEPPGAFLTHRDSLFELIEGSGQRLQDESRALLLAHGELLSSSLGRRILGKAGLDANWQDARTLLQATEDSENDLLSVRCGHGPDESLEERLASQGRLHITQGFIASDSRGRTCLLGRGGSDTSAACLAARLSASALEIWTDVPGIFSADPRVVPDARLLRQLSYMEAQELASMGAKVLHPPSIQPARHSGIPVWIKDTNRPNEAGTQIVKRVPGQGAQVKGVVSRGDITVITMSNPAMWRQAGFLADAFAVFKRHGYSVDLISTSESTVTVSLDPQVTAHYDRDRMAAFLQDLESLCRVKLYEGCTSISLVGNAIRTILGRLSAALDVFQDRHVHMVTQSANDLNLTLVVDSGHAASLVRKLHQVLISSRAESRPEFGPSWSQMTQSPSPEGVQEPWWRHRSEALLKLMQDRESAYVYDRESVRMAARRLKSMASVGRVLYAVKANDNVELLRLLAEEGLGFECVSWQEVEYVLEQVPGIGAGDILFTPNFAPREEYSAALDRGVRLTIDNAWAVHQWPELFAGREVFLRIDLEAGYGHHKKVVTAGSDSKFGISRADIEGVVEVLDGQGARVTGLHSHTGSGVNEVTAWREQLERFIEILPWFPDVRVLDLGGGLGVPDRPGKPSFDLGRLDGVLGETIGERDIELWLEPGRYLVAESGVLLSRVTQLKSKGQHRYLGLATGMNSLIRPALYGAYHEIVNLSRLEQEATVDYRVVGPICESGDVLGESRLLPGSAEGDIVLVANAGAYGRVMASNYNRRQPAEELVI